MNMEQCREKILLMLALNVIISLAIFHLRILCFELMFLAMYVVVVTTKDIAFCIEIEWWRASINSKSTFSRVHSVG